MPGKASLGQDGMSEASPASAHDVQEPRVNPKGRFIMLWTVALLLLVLWGLGLVTSYTLGGFIHILLVLAVVAVVIRLIQGRRLT